MKNLGITSRNLWIIIALAVGSILIASCGAKTEKSANQEVQNAPSVNIHEAAFFGNVKAIKQHIEYKSDLNEKDPYGSTPLHIAITFGRTETALALIEGGADLSSISSDGSTPLHAAAFYCRTEVVDALLKQNVDMTVRNSFGVTALESVQVSFADIKPAYDQIGKSLGPLGLKLDYDHLEKTRPMIAALISAKSNQ
ncbi:MAG: ankyrin repeat domain-containing protein [Cyclobacteriaceae bacterium]